MTDQRFVVTRTIAASPAAVFAILADPARHQDTEPGDWVRDAVTSDLIAAPGQVFAMNMYLDRAGGHYVMHNLVSDFVADKTIAWLPGRLDESGALAPGGWSWRYDLEPNGTGTDVTLTYDWTNTPQSFRDQIGGMPPFSEDFLTASLAALERAAT